MGWLLEWMSVEVALLAALVSPLAGAALVVALGPNPNARDGSSLVAGVVTFLCVLRIAMALQAGEPVAMELWEPTPGLLFALEVEPLGLLFALVASLLWPITTLYAIGYMRAHHEEHQTRFFAFFAITISAVLALAFSANLASLFVCYEAITLATFPLVTHSNDRTAWRAGRVYLGILMGTSVGLLLFGVLGVHALAGTTRFTPGGVLAGPLADGNVSKATLGVLLGLFVFGAAKAAVMPFHRWLPNAMVAPTPVSALLHAVAVVKAGVFTILKVVVYIFGLDLVRELHAHTLLLYVAGFTVVAASVIAMHKDNLKERLAYSTIGQLSYIVLGALLVAPESVQGAGLHIAAHAAGKITLFFGAGALLVTAHKKYVSELDGIGRQMPITMACFAIGSLSIIGLPPTGGMWSKLLLIEGAYHAGHGPVVVALLISSLLSVVYLLSIPVRAFLRPAPTAQTGEHPHHGPAPWTCRIAMVLTAGLSVWLFLFPDFLYDLVVRMTEPTP